MADCDVGMATVGMLLRYETDTPGTFADVDSVGGLTSIPVGGVADQIDKPCLNSTIKLTVNGQIDFGEMSCEVNYDPTNTSHLQLMTDLNTPGGVVREWQVVFPAATAQRLSFNGHVTGFTIDAGNNAVLSGTLTVKADTNGIVEADV